MTLMQMEKNCGAKVKQLPDGRWWIRLNGKVIKKTSREAIFEEIIKRHHEQNNLEFIKAAEKWLEIRKIEKAAGIFRRGPQKHIQHCNTRCYETRIKRFCQLANMDVLKSQHDIRRTFCTNLYYTGMPLKNIQKLMGHSSLKQTMDYIKFKEDDKNVLLEQLNSI